MSTHPFDIVVMTRATGDTDDPRLWDDLRVCLWSVAAYGGEHRCVVAWEGPRPPDHVPETDQFVYAQRPDGLSFSRALTFGVELTTTPGFINLQDDAVLHPDTLVKLHEDLETLIDSQRRRVGILGCRSNYVVGAQNIRSDNGGTLTPNSLVYSSENETFETDYVFPVCAWWDRAAYDHIGGMADGLVWFTDLLYCWDLGRISMERHISRGYVHHIGSRSTAGGSDTDAQQRALMRDGIQWLADHRRDFFNHLDPSLQAMAVVRDDAS